MKLEYSSLKDDDIFILSDFNCAPSKELLKNSGLYKIIWSRDQSVEIIVDGYSLILEKNQVVFCTSLNILEIEADPKGLIAFVFNREFYCIQTHDEEVSCNGFLFFGSSFPQVITLSEKEIKRFTMMVYFFEEEFAIKDHIQGEMLRTLLKRLLIISSRLVKNNLPDSGMPKAQMDIVRKFNLLLEMHFREKHKVSDYAAMLHKSPKTISNLFRKYSDKTPLSIINERIVLEAKRLLLYSNKTTEEIAYELGYSEAAHFSKFFKKNEGLNPTSFKKKKLDSK